MHTSVSGNLFSDTRFCNRLLYVRNDMQGADVYIESERRLEVPKYESAAREMQDVLSSRLPSFYRVAYRLLRNAADAEDAVQDALFTAYKHLDQFR